MSNRSQAAQQLRDGHYSTLHAFFLAAKESGWTEFELQLVMNPKDRIEFSIRPRGHSELKAKFDVRGNTVRTAISEAGVILVEDADVRINYGGTRSGEQPLPVRPDWDVQARMAASISGQLQPSQCQSGKVYAHRDFRLHLKSP